MTLEPSIIDLNVYGKVIGTRSLGRQIASEHSPDDALVYVRVDKVRVISSPVFDELLKAWPGMQLLGADDDLQNSFDSFVSFRRGEQA